MLTRVLALLACLVVSTIPARAGDYALASDGKDQYAAAVLEGEGTTHFLYVLRCHKGHWRYAAVGGGSVTGIPDVADMALYAHFPAAVAKKLSHDINSDEVQTPRAGWPPDRKSPLWSDLKRALEKPSMRGKGTPPWFVSEELVVTDYAVATAGGVDYLLRSFDVNYDSTVRHGCYYQLFRRKAGTWRFLGSHGPVQFGRPLSPWLPGWLRRQGLPGAAVAHLGRFGDAEVTYQALPYDD